MITKTQLLQMMMTEDLEKAADELLQAALLGGGKDNISLVLLQDNTDIPEKANTETTESIPSDITDPEEVTDQ